ncbi:unnamed protein product [Closterium sp. NIES-65]|nr:unnamed protein product [Closterium sp. NIES-65]
MVLPSIRVGHSGGGAFESLASDAVEEKKKLTLGVCVMEKKVGGRGRVGARSSSIIQFPPSPSAPLPPSPFGHPHCTTPLAVPSRSSPMTAILDRLRMFGEVEVRPGGGEICGRWPICDALIAFYSTGFPLAKAQQYAALRNCAHSIVTSFNSHFFHCSFVSLPLSHSPSLPSIPSLPSLPSLPALLALLLHGRPYLVNELEPQWLLHDRRKVYAKLEEHGLMMPTYAIVNREGEGEGAEEEFEEEEDYVVIAGKRINKPFVEKPVDGGRMGARCDDHSVMIYYPSSAGGGMKELFRKYHHLSLRSAISRLSWKVGNRSSEFHPDVRHVGNRSSEFHPDVRHVRRHGSYIYEEFLPTGKLSALALDLPLGACCCRSNPSVHFLAAPWGTDVKVYTVGPDYAHAEARKSPVVDGVVMRSADGKEIRYPVLLTPTEKEMARVICLAFGQAVCGFDLLRSHGRSFVCDVNGWSFVKNSTKYYDDAACVLRSMLLRAVAPHLYSPLPVRLPWSSGPDAAAVDGTTSPDYERTLTSVSSFNSVHTFGTREELRCVIAVIRHGDRTPKQKVKLVVTQERLLKLMLKYNGGKPRSEAKLKSAVQLQDLLDALRALVPHQRDGSDSETEDFENAEKLRHVKAVLEEGGHFSGIYRKAQLKPQKWERVQRRDSSGGEVEVDEPTEALMVLKYGGVLTHAGRAQAEHLGRAFREAMYPDEMGSNGTGLLRLHSTYRHDLKIYSSDEGRVQMSAAAFIKGLLDLEGQLTPILVSLVSKDSPMLDGLDSASIEMEHAKRKLGEMMTTNDPPVLSPTHGQPPAALSPRRPSQSRSHSRSSSSSSHGGSSAQLAGPWMTDAPWLPDRPLSKLHKLVELIKALAAHAKEKCREDDVDGALEAKVEEAVKKLRIVPVPPQHKAGAGEQQQKGAGEQQGGAQQQGGGKQKAVPYDGTVLGKARFDESRIAAGLPCGTEEFLLIFARWKKLERDIYNPRKDRFNISKIPDVYDSAKYDLVHNRHLGLKGLDELYLLAKARSLPEMANGVIPNEYGITPYSKLKIGAKVAQRLLGKILIDLHNQSVPVPAALKSPSLPSHPSLPQVARRLLGKMLIDLHNTRDEAVAVGQAMQQHRQSLREQRAAAVAAAVFNQEQQRQNRRSSGEAKRRSDGHSEGDNDDSNAQYRLDPK